MHPQLYVNLFYVEDRGEITSKRVDSTELIWKGINGIYSFSEEKCEYDCVYEGIEDRL